MKLLANIILFTALICFFAYRGYHDRLTYEKEQIIYKPITTISEITLLKSSVVPPIIYTSVISLDRLPVASKKRAFISMILPSILLIKQNIDIQREHVKSILTKYIISKHDQQFLKTLMQRYNVSNPRNLLNKMIVPPNSLIIAQAAVESGWGTSRFFVQANNIFGIWSLHAKHESIQASEARDGYTVRVRRYDSIQQSIQSYLLTLATNKHYKAFRQTLIQTKNPYILAEKLKRYSELGRVYTKRLRQVILQNNLMQYDDYHLAIN